MHTGALVAVREEYDRQTGDKEVPRRTRWVSPNGQGMSGYLCPT